MVFVLQQQSIFHTLSIDKGTYEEADAWVELALPNIVLVEVPLGGAVLVLTTTTVLVLVGVGPTVEVDGICWSLIPA